jgi:DNA primase
MALFSILVQFFDTPLNIPEFKQLFQPNRLNDEDKVKLKNEERKAKYEKHARKNVKKVRNFLAHYCERMKAKLGVGKNRWTALTQKPWPMNYEDIWREEYPDKYDGNFLNNSFWLQIFMSMSNA